MPCSPESELDPLALPLLMEPELELPLVLGDVLLMLPVLELPLVLGMLLLPDVEPLVLGMLLAELPLVLG
jgi:hypothetical protein